MEKQDLLTVKEPVANRNVKDSMFTMVFKKKENQLSVFNALNGTNYQDTSKLQVTTLEKSIYLGYANDVSFFIDHSLSLYEHQSTYNPNMPYRDLIYVTRQYERFIQGRMIYGATPVVLPRPFFVVFYNGDKPMPDESELKLSDLYPQTTHSKDVNLELVVKVLNIKKGHCEELKKKS